MTERTHHLLGHDGGDYGMLATHLASPPQDSGAARRPDTDGMGQAPPVLPSISSFEADDDDF